MIAPGCNSMDAQRHLDFGNGCLSRGSHSSLIDSREGRQSHPCRKLPNQNTLLPRGHDQQCNQCHPVEIRRRTRFSYQRLPLPKEHLELWGLSEQRCPLVAPSQSSHLGCCQTQFGFGIHAKTFGSYPAPWQRKGGSWKVKMPIYLLTTPPVQNEAEDCSPTSKSRLTCKKVETLEDSFVQWQDSTIWKQWLLGCRIVINTYQSIFQGRSYFNQTWSNLQPLQFHNN